MNKTVPLTEESREHFKDVALFNLFTFLKSFKLFYIIPSTDLGNPVPFSHKAYCCQV